MVEKMRPIYDYSVLCHLGVIESAFPRNKGVKAALKMVKDVVKTAPTVSPDEIGFPEIPCSICGYKSGHYGFNYCPNCGAKMKVSKLDIPFPWKTRKKKGET